MPRVMKILVKRKDKGGEPINFEALCTEISIKDVCEECEKTTLYPEDNCGHPTKLILCEEGGEVLEEDEE